MSSSPPIKYLAMIVLPSCYNLNIRQLENLSNAFNGQIDFLISQVCGLLYDSVITNHLRNHKQIDMCLVELAHMNEPCFLHPLHFSLPHRPYYVMHATDEINHFKIFPFNWLLQCLHLSTL